MKEWGEYQHYKDRHPPWIKLHAKVLSNYAYRCLRDASKSHLIALWVLASKFDNRIPYDLAFITQMIGATEPIDIEELVLQGFIEVSQDDGRALSPRPQDASKPLAPKTEVETEKEKRPAKERGGWVARFGVPYSEASGGIAPLGEIGKHCKPLVDRDGEEPTYVRWLAFCLSDKRKFGAAYFAKNAGDFDPGKFNGLTLSKDERRAQHFKKMGYVT